MLNLKRLFPKLAQQAKRSAQSAVTVGGNGGAIRQQFITAPDTPKGFTLRAAWDEKTNPTGATTILEKWDAGSEEPPHSHPGDDATIVIEGKMSVSCTHHLLLLNLSHMRLTDRCCVVV